MTELRRIYVTKSPDETGDLAVKIGSRLSPGHVVLLQGAVGAGKTQFARALIQSILSSPEDVPSPTFTLIQTYETTKGEVWHSDLYRLTATDEVIELGLEDAFETAICLLEWPDRLGELTPENAVLLDFQTNSDHERTITATGPSDVWGDILPKDAHD